MKSVNPVCQIIVVRTAQASLVALAAHWLLYWPLTGPHAVGLFLTPALCVYFVFVFVAQWSWGLPILTRLPRGERVVALTFDDGPSPETTPYVLETLREFGVHATFFVLGEAVDRSPGLLREIIADGHTLGIHAYRHRPFVLLNIREIMCEIQQTQEAISRACPDAALSPWVRPPYGFKSFAALWAIRGAGGRFAAWSLDSRDYHETDPARMAQNVLGHLQPGAVILLHDGPSSAVTVSALPIILQVLKDEEWQCVLFPQTLGANS
ncbi:MAG: polysaccharide deacetylase family protein [Armatimonadota bacterium]|nr:polysaccharide deacetylase family protein [Armatimonadota bacterium]